MCFTTVGVRAVAVALDVGDYGLVAEEKKNSEAQWLSLRCSGYWICRLPCPVRFAVCADRGECWISVLDCLKQLSGLASVCSSSAEAGSCTAISVFEDVSDTGSDFCESRVCLHYQIRRFFECKEEC